MQGITKLTMRLPGSTTNLGPGFDTLGLALGVYTTVTFTLAPDGADDTSGGASAGAATATHSTKTPVTLIGPLAQGLPASKDNLIYRVFLENLPGGLEHTFTAKSAGRIRVSIETDIPLARGLGSSSTAIVAALWAAQTFSSGTAPDPDQILARAARLEGHPDNVAACLMGGFIISGYRQKGNRALLSRLDWPEKWHTLVVVPPYELSTAEARRVLPRRVGMTQAVNNIQRTALLIGAVVNGDDDLLQEALFDQLHEPYRMHLVPELEALRRDLSSLPVLGCVLSGAGSSCLVLVHEKHKKEVKAFLDDWGQKRQDKPQILDLTVDKQGLIASYE